MQIDDTLLRTNVLIVHSQLAEPYVVVFELPLVDAY